MAIEAGARAGQVAVDETTIEYIQGRPYAPSGEILRHAVQYWRTLHSDADAKFDQVVELRAEEIQPQVTWGTSPEMVLPISERVPDPEKERDPNKRSAMERALQYMNLIPNTLLSSIPIDKVFIGSCTNSRIEDLRAAAKVVDRLGKKVSPSIKLAMVVPGSGLVKAQAEREGLDRLLVLLTLTPQLLLEHLYTVLQVSDLILLELEFREPLGLTKRVYILVDGA
jgi:3-isopropylmalate/(R)-2-methylmalate dehydratase large subunit